jgi:hypothetical protein
MAQKFNPYRQAAGDRRVWSQIRIAPPIICQECSQPIDIRMELLHESGKCEACAKKESK